MSVPAKNYPGAPANPGSLAKRDARGLNSDKFRQRSEYDSFTQSFKQAINSAIDTRDRVADTLRSQRLSPDDFLQYEEELAKLGGCEELKDHGGINVLFDESVLRQQFAHEYWKKFPKKTADDAEEINVFDWMENPN